MTGEAARIRALAERLRHEAGQVRATAVRVAATEQVAWCSPAATAFRRRTQAAAAHLRRSARLLEEAARAVDDHALAVERTLAELAELARVGLRTVAGGR